MIPYVVDGPKYGPILEGCNKTSPQPHRHKLNCFHPVFYPNSGITIAQCPIYYTNPLKDLHEPLPASRA